MNRFRKQISVALLFALFFYVAPKELVHEFFHHDTVDAIVDHDAGASLEKEHFHCDLLQLTAPPFQQPITAFSFCVSFCTFSFIPQQDNFLFKDITASQYLRGPPSVS